MLSNTTIIPGKSMAGIELGRNALDVLCELPKECTLEEGEFFFAINGGYLTVYYDEDYTILSISCNSRFSARYKNKIWAGMQVLDVLQHTQRQVALGGFLVVDNIRGIGLPLPEEYDDFERLTDFLSLDYCFETLWVSLAL